MAEAIILTPETRPRELNVIGEKITILANKAQTDGYELFLQDGVAGVGAPPHSHGWDESFFVLKGNIDFGVGEKSMIATPGTLVHIPAGTTHWFTFQDDDGEMLSITGVGSGASEFFSQIDRDVAGPEDVENLGKAAHDHEVTFPGAPG
jgi:quercetin dioxygenase-like cupin family protein